MIYMLLCSRTTKKAVTVDARETAPAAASQDMYVANPDLSKTGESRNQSVFKSVTNRMFPYTKNCISNTRLNSVATRARFLYVLSSPALRTFKAAIQILNSSGGMSVKMHSLTQLCTLVLMYA